MEKKQLLDNKIFTIDHFLTNDQCKFWIDRGEEKRFNPSPISGGGHGRTGREDPRTSQFVVFVDQEKADDMWSEVIKFLPANLTHLTKTADITSDENAKLWSPVGINPRMRLYKYEKGQAFPEHIDYKMFRYVWRNKRKYKQQTFMTLLIYLNDDFTDGETGFWTQHDVIGVKEHCRFLRGIEDKPHQLVVKPQTGMALISDQNIIHEGIPPGKGVKYVLRTDIVYEKHIPIHPKVFRNYKPVDLADHEEEWEKQFEASCKNYAD